MFLVSNGGLLLDENQDDENSNVPQSIEEMRRFLGEEEKQEYIERMKTDPYEPKVMFIVMRYDCVFSCDQCFFYGNPNTNTVLPDEAIDRAIDFASEIGISDIVLTGGEPMIDPPKVFRAIEKIKDNGLNATLQSVYLGDTEKQIEENAKRIAELGVDTFSTSLSMYHQATKPAAIQESYLDNLLMIIDAVTNNGINVDIKNTWDVSIGETDSLNQANEFAKCLLEAGARFMGAPFAQREYMFLMNDAQIFLVDNSIISVGKAKSKGLISQKEIDWEESRYNCPIFYQSHQDGGMLTIYPDGKVARCCSAEKNADFGFGNMLTHPFDEIIENIRKSEYVHPDMSYILRAGHNMLKEEYPHLLPENGASQACEICSPIVSHESTRNRLSERLGKPDLFTPYNQRKNYWLYYPV